MHIYMYICVYMYVNDASERLHTINTNIDTNVKSSFVYFNIYLYVCIYIMWGLHGGKARQRMAAEAKRPWAIDVDLKSIALRTSVGA